MKSIVFLAAFVSATLGAFGCASLTPKGDVLDKTGLVDAEAIVWHDVYGRTDKPPR